MYPEDSQAKPSDLLKTVDLESCTWVGSLRNAKNHYETCHFKKSICANVGCGFETNLKSLPDHAAICQFQVVQCEWCQVHKTILDLGKHKEFCPRRPLQCPNACLVGELCNDPITLVAADEILQHRTVCQLEKIGCPFTFAGCAAPITRRDCKFHIEDPHSLRMHTNALLSTVSQFQEEIVFLEAAVKDNHLEKSKLRTKLEILQEKLVNSNKEIVNLKNQHSDLDFLIPIPVGVTAWWKWRSCSFQPIYVAKPAYLAMTSTSGDFHSCFFTVKDIEGDETFCVEADFILHVNDNSPPLARTLTACFTKKNNTWGWKQFVKTSDLSLPKYRTIDGCCRMSVRVSKVTVK